MELSLYDMVGGDILEPGHSAHGGRLHRNSGKEMKESVLLTLVILLKQNHVCETQINPNYFL